MNVLCFLSSKTIAETNVQSSFPQLIYYPRLSAAFRNCIYGSGVPSQFITSHHFYMTQHYRNYEFIMSVHFTSSQHNDRDYVCDKLIVLWQFVRFFLYIPFYLLYTEEQTLIIRFELVNHETVHGLTNSNSHVK